MNRNLIKVLATVLLAVILVASIVTVANATSASSISAGTMFASAKDNTGTAGTVNTILGTLITVVQVIGVGVAIIMLIVLAIKYISAAPGDKAEIKKHAVVYVVGAVVLFAASGILGIIKNLASAFTESA